MVNCHKYLFQDKESYWFCYLVIIRFAYEAFYHSLLQRIARRLQMISEKVTPTQEKEVFMIYDHLQTGAKERPPSYEYNKIGEEFKAP